MPLIEKIQTLQKITHRLREGSEQHDDADLLEATANEIVHIVAHEISMRERQIYECEERLRISIELAAPWNPLSKIDH